MYVTARRSLATEDGDVKSREWLVDPGGAAVAPAGRDGCGHTRSIIMIKIINK